MDACLRRFLPDPSFLKRRTPAGCGSPGGILRRFPKREEPPLQQAALLVFSPDGGLFYFFIKRIPSVLGPQWLVTVEPASVSKISAKGGS